MCLTANLLEQLNPIPEGLKTGKALIYEQLDNSEQWGLALYNSMEASRKSSLLMPFEAHFHLMAARWLTLLKMEFISLIWLRKLKMSSAGSTGLICIGLRMGSKLLLLEWVMTSSTAFSLSTPMALSCAKFPDWSYETVIGWSPNGFNSSSPPPIPAALRGRYIHLTWSAVQSWSILQLRMEHQNT